MDISRRAALKAGMVAVGGSQITPLWAAAPTRNRTEILRLGCCYYPEQWPESMWAADAAAMAQRGVSRVRIAEFAWTLMEPEKGRYDWGWLDRIITILAKAKLGVVLGTPTAAPPHWLVEQLPEMLPVGEDGRTKQFGSRRYYSFASQPYRRECARIASAMADRYGRHPAVVGWQIDNEYGCHDTTYSYGRADRAGFRAWVEARYGTVARLNEAWGTSVWSQQVDSFAAVDLPVLTPTDHPPAKMLDYRRFASEQVGAFHQVQVDAIRPRSPGRFITHNFMANFTEFDPFPIGDAIDFASWDSYPLGVAAGRDEPRWDRTGNPDITGWNHDLMHAINPAPFWVMEQQPGPVNWARYNPAPMPGMVRLWAWEAFAYGASTVSHFRWRQAQVGPEQMHSALNRPDGAISPGGIEAAQVGREIQLIGAAPARTKAKVALLFDYQTVWTTEIQPNAVNQNHLAHAQSWYAALRGLGIDVDIVRPATPLDGYKLILMPSLATIDAATLEALEKREGLLVVGPRSGSKTEDFAIPRDLPPGPLQRLIPVKVKQTGTFRNGAAFPVAGEGMDGHAIAWREWLDTKLPVKARYEDGESAVVGTDTAWYVGCQGDRDFTVALMRNAARQAGLSTHPLPDHVRMRQRGDLQFAFNYGPDAWTIPDPKPALLLGQRTLAPYDVAIWRMAE
ncbi:beta-galactosidase [Sphingobium sp. AP50]|uniref:beta-galactosidase n=1 Tax=Sphingobium sp. AP50 TaxID=1884369 RepID=UPI0008CC2A37|nr:beta-galactosidase [Sphingobium sp. AP50]SEK00519.1 beta-galactosidase [Sphingobium sp. AP50]